MVTPKLNSRLGLWNLMIPGLTLCNYYSGWWFQPLWKIWKSIGITAPSIWENKIHVPNHQLVLITMVSRHRKFCPIGHLVPLMDFKSINSWQNPPVCRKSNAKNNGIPNSRKSSWRDSLRNIWWIMVDIEDWIWKRIWKRSTLVAFKVKIQSSRVHQQKSGPDDTRRKPRMKLLRGFSCRKKIFCLGSGLAQAGIDIWMCLAPKLGWLVVYLPLWKILVNWDDDFQYMEK